jgi:hypothetical protein
MPSALAIASHVSEALDASDPAEHKARTILGVARAAYSACDTYEDEGTYDISFRGDAGFSKEGKFHTVFAGPNRVRFAYRQHEDVRGPHDEFMQLIADDAGAEVTSPWRDAPEHATLDLAIAGLTGGAGGVPTAVVPLLPAGLNVRSALDLERPHAVGTEDVDGETCDLLEAERDHSRIKIWISQRDFLVRRITEDGFTPAAELPPLPAGVLAMFAEAGHPQPHFVQRDLSTFEVTTFHPRCNEPIAAGAFQATDGSL